MRFSQEIKVRIAFYSVVGLLSGLLLWVIECLERNLVLQNKFVQVGEEYLFSNYLVFTALGSLIWASFLVMCSTIRLATFFLIKGTPIKLAKFEISGKSIQNILSSLAIFSIFVLLWLLIDDYFSKPLYKMVTGLINIPIFTENRKLITFFILFVLAVLLNLFIAFMESLAELGEEIFLVKNSKIISRVTLIAILVLPITYYIDANFMVTRRDLSFHLPLYLVTLLISFVVAAKHYQWFIKDRLGRSIIVLSVVFSIFSGVVTILYFNTNQNAKSLFWQQSVIAKRYGLLARKISGQKHKDYNELLNYQTVENSLNPFDGEAHTFLPTDLFASKVSANTVGTITGDKNHNVIFLSIDTLRADHMGIYGYSRNITPNLDKFAKESILCEKGYSTGTNTGHSFASILRSALGDSIFNSSIPTVGELFNQNGYKTAFITSPQTDAWLNKKRWMDYKKILMNGFQEVTHQETKFWNAKEMTDRSIDLLERLKGDGSFFAWIHYTDPHAPYEQHPEYNFGYKDINLYDSEIAYTDAHIGRLLEFIKSSGLVKNTMIVFTSDHGEGFGEHNAVEHGTLPHIEQCFVPMWVYSPEVPHMRLSMPLSHIDLAPTMLDFANIMSPEQYEGTNISNIALGLTEANPYVISETPRNIPEPTFFAWALTQNDWRVIYDKVGGGWQLYNLSNDPKEQVNLADVEAVKLQQMKGLLSEYLNEQALKPNYSHWKSLKCMAKKKPKKFKKGF